MNFGGWVLLCCTQFRQGASLRPHRQCGEIWDDHGTPMAISLSSPLGHIWSGSVLPKKNTATTGFIDHINQLIHHNLSHLHFPYFFTWMSLHLLESSWGYQHHPLSILNLKQFTLSSWHTLPHVHLVYTPRRGQYLRRIHTVSHVSCSFIFPRFPQRGCTFLGQAASSAYLGSLTKTIMRESYQTSNGKDAKNKSLKIPHVPTMLPSLPVDTGMILGLDSQFHRSFTQKSQLPEPERSSKVVAPSGRYCVFFPKWQPLEKLLLDICGFQPRWTFWATGCLMWQGSENRCSFYTSPNMSMSEHLQKKFQMSQ